ncbi:hypothetical protein J1N35_011202 [Gossypium stocksii]|uniref:RRM domain-containing protein n=1 Tax=Gossypium stocksii TaxID=47602 RepID=A0A9D3W1Y9_9ROSI|nr:hypothetical protein J1N35_011202 [Gossypium stocksii]
MRKHFEKYGEILEAVIIFDKITGRSKGYGFDAEAAKKVCEDAAPIINGHCANYNIASLSACHPSVAKSFDAPIKLLFPIADSARLFSMLGLGDIVIPDFTLNHIICCIEHRWGNTPLDEARMCGNKNLIKLLEDAKSTQLSKLLHCSKEFTGIAEPM